MYWRDIIASHVLIQYTNNILIDFTLFMPCVSNGGTFVDTQLNTSGLIDDYVVNNSFTFFFYKICMPDNISEYTYTT